MRNVILERNCAPFEQNYTIDLRVFEGMPVNSVLLFPDAPDYTVITATLRYLRDFSVAKEDIEGKCFLEAFPKSSTGATCTEVKKLTDSFQAVVASGKEDFLQLKISGADNKPNACYLNVTNLPVLADDGTVQYIIHTVEPSKNDAGIIPVSAEETDKVRAKKELDESEARFRSLVEESPVATALFTGLEMTIQLANQPMINIWGRGNSVLGKPLVQAMPELGMQHFLPLMQELYTTGRTYEAKGGRADLEVNGILKTFYFDYYFTPIRNAAGDVYAILNMAQEVTEQVVAKNKIEESRQNLRNIILQAPVAMCILKGPAYIVEIANERMFELMGKTAEEILDKPLLEGLHEVKNQGLEDLLRNTYTTGEAFKALERPLGLPRNGKMETLYLDFVYEACYESNGVITGIMVVATDVSEKVRARQEIEEVVAQRTRELAQANKALLQSNLELEQLVYITTHDLQEPLRKVTTYSDMLRLNLGEIDEPSKTYLSRLTSSTVLMRQLINDVLDLSQLSAGDKIVGPVNLSKVVSRIISDFKPVIEQKQAVVHCSSLPIVQAVPLQMQQLFGNLLSNALKFTKEGMQPVITLSAQPLPETAREEHAGLSPDRQYILIGVEDNGIGFDQEYAGKIFRIFQRLHGKAAYAGTGMGLALCKKIAHNHQGEIWAASVKNKGSVFYVALPLH